MFRALHHTRLAASRPGQRGPLSCDGRRLAIGNLRHVEALGFDPGVLRDRPVIHFDVRADVLDGELEAAVNAGADALVTHNVRDFRMAAPQFGFACCCRAND